jgi:two-component system, response regulator
VLRQCVFGGAVSAVRHWFAPPADSCRIALAPIVRPLTVEGEGHAYLMKRKAADILLVEDDAFEVELTLHALRKHCPACLIDVVRDGDEALDYLFYRGNYDRRDCAQPRLLLLDINLPKRTGIEVLAAMKADARLRTIPVVMLTSSLDSTDVEECYRSGANGYVVKPLDYQRFDQVIGAMCLYWLEFNAAPGQKGKLEAVGGQCPV